MRWSERPADDFLAGTLRTAVAPMRYRSTLGELLGVPTADVAMRSAAPIPPGALRYLDVAIERPDEQAGAAGPVAHVPESFGLPETPSGRSRDGDDLVSVDQPNAWRAVARPDAAVSSPPSTFGGDLRAGHLEGGASAVRADAAGAARPDPTTLPSAAPETPTKVWDVSLPHHARPFDTTAEPERARSRRPDGATPEVEFVADLGHDTVQPEAGPAASTTVIEDATRSSTRADGRAVRPARTVPGETHDASGANHVSTEAVDVIRPARSERPPLVDLSPTGTDGPRADEPRAQVEAPGPTAPMAPRPAIESSTSSSSAPPAMPHRRTGDRAPRTDQPAPATSPASAPAGSAAAAGVHRATPQPPPTTVMTVAAPAARRPGYRARLHLGRIGLRGPR